MGQPDLYDGLDVSKVTNLYCSGMTWEFLKRLQETTKMKVVLRGIMEG